MTNQLVATFSKEENSRDEASGVSWGKLTNNSKKNKLFKAFRELGNVIRTLFLLEYILDEKLTKYPNGSFFLFFKGRFHFIQVH